MLVSSKSDQNPRADLSGFESFVFDCNSIFVWRVQALHSLFRSGGRKQLWDPLGPVSGSEYFVLDEQWLRR